MSEIDRFRLKVEQALKGTEVSEFVDEIKKVKVCLETGWTEEEYNNKNSWGFVEKVFIFILERDKIISKHANGN